MNSHFYKYMKNEFTLSTESLKASIENVKNVAADSLLEVKD